MLKGAYCGPRKELLGYTALLRSDEIEGEPVWLAQFDDINHFYDEQTYDPENDPMPLCFGWHYFDYDDFEIIDDAYRLDEIESNRHERVGGFVMRLLRWYIGAWLVIWALIGFVVLKGIATVLS